MNYVFPILFLLCLLAIGMLWLRRRRVRLLEELFEMLSAMRVGQDLQQVLAEMLDKLRGILEARSALLFFYDPEEEQLYRWLSEPGRPTTQREIPQIENPLWIDFDKPESLERLEPAHPLPARLGAQQVLSVGCAARGYCARWLLLDPQNDAGPRSDVLLQRVAGLLFSLAQQVFLVERVRAHAVDEERARIAGDFHDGPLQTFYSFDVHLQFIRQMLAQDPESAAGELESLQQMARRQAREMRDLLQEMRPVDQEGATLERVLRHLVEDAQKGGDLSVRLLTEAHNLEVPRKMRRQIYQVLREALNNARKHARAKHVVVSLEESPGCFTLTVDDDGAGFQFSGRHTLEEMDRLRIGPVSIKQRARQMGADLAVESTPGHGARLILRVPLSAAAGPTPSQIPDKKDD